jgi:hypothetical protein
MGYMVTVGYDTNFCTPGGRLENNQFERGWTALLREQFCPSHACVFHDIRSL